MGSEIIIEGLFSHSESGVKVLLVQGKNLTMVHITDLSPVLTVLMASILHMYICTAKKDWRLFPEPFAL